MDACIIVERSRQRQRRAQIACSTTRWTAARRPDNGRVSARSYRVLNVDNLSEPIELVSTCHFEPPRGCVIDGDEF